MHCFVKDCPNNKIRTKQIGLSFHSIPKRLKSQWLTAIGRDPNIFINQQRICSEHFQDDDFEKIGFHKRLKADVIPTLNLPDDYTRSEIIIDAISPIYVPVEQSEIITIELERSSPEEIYDNIFPVEDIEESMPSSPLVIMNDSDTVTSDEEPLSGDNASANNEPEVDVKENLKEKQISDSSNVFPCLSPETSSGSSTKESFYISPLHYLKRLKQEQEKVKFFKSKYKAVQRTSNRRKKKIIYLETALNDLKNKIKQSTDALKPD